MKFLEKAPLDFNDCIRYAWNKYEKYFVNDIKQLLYVYPIDMKTKDGTLFWQMPKRPPTPIPYDPLD